MATKVLIVDPDIAFAIGIKRALEQSGNCRVTAFANGQAAVELIRADPQDIVIIDFNVGDMDIGALIGALRIIQPGLFVLVSPRTAAHITRLAALDVQGSITKPYLARQLIPVIREAVSARSRLAKKAKAPPPLTRLTEPPIQPDDTFRRQTDEIRPDKPATAATLRKTLEIAIQTAPPVSDNATIGDLVSGKPMIDPPASLPEQPPSASEVPPPAPPARARSDIASAALDVLGTMPNQDFTLQAYVDQVEQQTGQTLLNEPSFVRSILSAPLSPEPSTFPVVTAPRAVDVPAENVLDEPEDDRTDTEPLPELAPDLSTEFIADSPEPVAAIALHLTQLAMQSAARATILTRIETVVAVAGDLSERAISGVVESLFQAWQTNADESSALIRFIQVPGVGDFLMYSMRSVDDLRLSMLFPAETSLRVIRKQAQQLIEALEKAPAESDADKTLISRPTDLRPPEGWAEAVASVDTPDAEPIPPQMPAPAIAPVAPHANGPYSAYGFVWLPRKNELAAELTGSLIGWLNEVAAAHSWQMEGIELQPAYVSVQISIPANETPTATIETMLRETASRAENTDLWADAYYVVSPGRAVTQQEITQFMSYRRSAEQFPAA